jgi:TonB-linked SusC/RagA family outer membrane protein
LLACLLMASIGLVNAQTRTASGKVVSAEDGQPVIGASIAVKGAPGIGTVTDLEGKFSLNVPGSSRTLVVSYIGMKTQELAAKANMFIQLQSSASELDEVMVVAYGTAKKSSFTGSAGVVKSETLARRQVSNVTNALAGQVAGVQVTSANGQPGTAATVRIRGIGSMSASNSPLYVVDGVPYDGTISAINPNDIESMNVLKDAAASAIYGARGANGVIIITTKKGKTGDADVTFDAKWGNNSREVSNYNVMTDPAMYYETFYKALYNSKAQNGNSAAVSHAFAQSALFDKSNGGLGYQVYTVPAGENLIGTNFKLNPNATLGYKDNDYYYTPDNWYNELFDKGNVRQEYNASVSGSTDKLNFYFSAGYLDDSGLISGSGFTRYTTRSKVDYQAKKWLKIGANMAYTYYNIKSPGAQTSWGSSGNLFYVADMMAPIYPMYVRNADGSLKIDNNGTQVYDFGNSTNQIRAFMALSNPAITLQLDKHNAYTDVINSKYYAIVDIIEGLKFNVNIGSNVRNQRSSNLYNLFYGSAVSDEGDVDVSHYREVGLNQQYLLTYNKSIGLNNFDILAGYELYSLTIQNLSVSSKKLYSPDVAEIDNAIYSPAAVSSNTDYYKTAGFLARVQYDYASRIFASASYRRDGSSRFSPENRWGNFGSFGGAWLINKENFFENLNANWIDQLKIKASYGIQGNDNLGNYYASSDQDGVSNSNGKFATIFDYKGNKNITWETSYSLNTGVEFALFKERLNGSVEYFSRKTVDLLYNQPVPVSWGYSTIPMNIGSLINKGIEVDLNATLVKTKDINWSVNVNATSYKNKILDLAESIKETGIKGTMSKFQIGGSLYDTFLREYAGVNHDNGKALYYMADADGNYILDSDGAKTTTDDWSKTKQINLGSTLAKLYGGFGTTLTFKGFDLTAGFSYQLGGRMYDFSYEELMHNGDNAGLNWHMDILDAWSEDNTDSNIPRLNSGDDSYQLLSSRFLVSSDYLSLNSLNIGYTLPRNLTQKLDIKNVRVYFAGDNLGLITVRKGLDPRQTLGATSYTAAGSHLYSAPRTISAGVSLTF